jgi:RHS repeat-associated protein
MSEPRTRTKYNYDSDASCASPNSFAGLLVSKVDARGIRTCAQYDALNRETVVTYSNGDPTVTTTYDQSACLGLSACQNIGHQTGATDAAGSVAWSYQVDATNHRSVHVNQRTTTNVIKTTTYILDLVGNTTQVTYPTGRAVNFAFDAANRPKTVTDGSNGITYATDLQTAPTGCLTGAVCYTPQGTFYALSIGQTSTFTGLNLTHTYNSRLQPNEFKASSTGGNAIDISYNFVDSVSGKNAGHVNGITNNIDTTRSQNFTYDQLNRISTALTTSTHATSPTHCWGETYTLDAWANLTSIAATTNSNYTGCSQESGFSQTADGNNHLPSFSYDSSGNTQNDGAYTYSWDAESQLKSAGGVNYLYDDHGRRVSKSNGKLYWYDAGSEILAETDACGNTTAEYIFFGGKRIAMIPWSGASCSSTVVGNPIYYVEDLLGTSRVITSNAGVVCYDADFYPYGGERSYTNNCPATNNYKFEGKERDTETGNDAFGARYYTWRFGRWLSADWSSTPVAVPYANLTNPQTLNLYAMVSDDPESFADLDGHQTADPERDKDPEEEARDKEELKEILDRLAEKTEEREAREAADSREAFQRFVNGQGGFDDPLTGACYATDPNAGRPTMRSSRPGTRGKPDHQQTADEEAAKRPGSEREGTIPTPGGEKGSRRGDVVVRDSSGKATEVVQVIRPNKNRTAPAREVRAANDITATGAKVTFVPVRPIIPNQKLVDVTPPDL